MKELRFWVLGLLALVFNVLGVQGQTAREISDKAMDVMKFGSMEMQATLKILDAKGRERVRKLTTSSKDFNGVSKTLLKFNSPADVRGIALLIYDYDDKSDDMWIYLPALRKSRRIVSRDKGKSFMGSEFSNADMSMPSADDFTFKILGEEVFDKQNCWMIESVCNDEDIEDENGYHRKVSWIDKELYLCYKVEFYNFDNELYKIQLINDYRNQSGGKQFAYYMEMLNVKSERKSIMIVDQFTLNANLTEQFFSPAMLDK